MGNFIGILLYVTGYTYDYKENVNDPPLNIRAASNSTYVTREVSARKKGCISRIPGHLYNALVIIIMIWRVFYTAYMTIRDKDIVPFGRSIFQILFVMQYILGIMYFRKKHFYQNISTKSEMITLLKICAPFTIVISLGLAITHTALMATGTNIHGYSDIYDEASLTGQISLAVLLFVDTIYSYQTFMINTCVFVINMIFHKNHVSSYAKDLTDGFIRSDQDVSSKVNTISTEYSLMKDAFDETVAVLTPFFTTLNFVGFLSIYFYVLAIKDKDISADEITNLVIFVIVEVVYIISIQSVNMSITKISDATSSTAMVAMYFTGNAGDDYHTLEMFSRAKLGQVDVEMGMLRGHMQKITTRGNNDGNNNNFHKKDNSGSFTDGSEYEGTNSSGNAGNGSDNHGSKSKRDQEYVFEDIYHHHASGGEVYTTDPNLNASMRNVMTTVNGVQDMMNWIALQGITSAQWRTFRIFGVQVTDMTLISRLFGLAVAILISAELGDRKSVV